MCGICGFVGAPNRGLVERMCRTLVHRGPDDDGFYLGDRASLGVRRLSVIDIPGGKQPVADERGRLTAVYNGEIYNFRELRRGLGAKGHRFRAEGDSEVIPHAYEQYGTECVQHFNGMFAFAIWDEDRGELFLARDRLGIKPLFYWQDGERLVFGSEIKAILQDPQFERRVDQEVLFEYLARKYVPGNRTMFKGIRSLPPGCWLRFRNGVCEIQEYWRPTFSPKWKKSERELSADVLELLHESVRRRLIADVPLGVFLSGGVDSSAVAALANELRGGDLETFSLGFDAALDSPHARDETADARFMAGHLGTRHREFRLHADDLLRELPRICWHFDQPYAGSVPQYFLSRFAQEHVTVALSGLGGDELFGNYGRAERLEQWLGRGVRLAQRVPGVAGNPVLAALLGVVPDRGPGVRIRRKLGAVVRPDDFEPDLYDQMLSLLDQRTREALCIDRAGGRAGAGGHFPNRTRHLFGEAACSDRGDRVFYTDLRTELVGEYLRYGDALTMSHSLEMRVPFLDHELVEYAARIPVHVRNASGKALLKSALRGVLPDEVLQRPKLGFSLPYNAWLRHELRPALGYFLGEGRLREQGFFDASLVASWVREHWEGHHDYHTLALWNLFVFQIWHWIYLENGCMSVDEIPPLPMDTVGSSHAGAGTVR